MGKLRVYCLKTLKKLSNYPLGNTPSAPSVFARVVTNDSPTEGRTLVRIEMVATELATSHTADRVNKVCPIQVFEPVLIRVVGVGTAVELVGRRVFPTFLVTCIL